MSDSESSQLQDDSNDDIYKDIPEFNFEDELAKLEGSKEIYKQEASDLSEKVQILLEENKELKKSNEVLKKNLSTLLKTAQAEVQRKDSMIQELRNNVESLTFRRNKTITKDKYTSTDDLPAVPEGKHESEKSFGDKNRSKSFENHTSGDSVEREKERNKESSTGKEDNSNCDNGRKSSHHRDNSKSNFRHSENFRDSDSYKDRKSSRYESSSGYRRTYRKDLRDHLKYDSFDKKRHSRSSDSRFLSKRRNSRDKWDDRRRGDSPDRRRRHRSGESSERSRKRNLKKDRSHSREISRERKESFLEKPMSTSSADKDGGRSKDQINTDLMDGVKNPVVEIKRWSENSDQRTSQGDEAVTDVKCKQVKEKRSGKHEKKNLDIFTTKSPLDALYDEMVSSINSNSYSKSKPSSTPIDFDVADSELFVTQPPNKRIVTSETQPEEDWTLSFKNERSNDAKPMTLYSRRMMRKFSLEVNKTKTEENKDEKIFKAENEKGAEVKIIKNVEDEKEPGELTDDENIVESSKEFQELTKVASIETKLIEKPIIENIYRESTRKDSFKLEESKVEPVQVETQKEVEKSASIKEDPNLEIHEVIEFSPFKNNYKLIRISPMKLSNSEHVLDFYNKQSGSTQPPVQSDLSSMEEKPSPEKNSGKPSDTSEEKDSWKNSSSEKDSESELKIFIPAVSESPKEKKPLKKKEKGTSKKSDTKNKVTKESEIVKEGSNVERRKRRSLRKVTEKSGIISKVQKRKRKPSETDESELNCKKRKTEKIESSQRSTRSKKNSKSEPGPQPESEEETKTKEDVSCFKFFKPATKAEVSKTPVCTSVDYKMTATMNVTGMVTLETPNKCVEKLKNLMINEQMIVNVKSNSQFSPLVGSNCTEMTPRRMLKNDLMLTDSEDDSLIRKNTQEEELGEEEEDEISGSENSECDSDSGASNFVDLL